MKQYTQNELLAIVSTLLYGFADIKTQVYHLDKIKELHIKDKLYIKEVLSRNITKKNKI